MHTARDNPLSVSRSIHVEPESDMKNVPEALSYISIATRVIAHVWQWLWMICESHSAHPKTLVEP